MGRLAAVVALVTAVVFSPSLSGKFVSWDDYQNFVDNPSWRGLGWDQLRWMWTTFHLGHYHPLTWMTLGVDYDLWGMNPKGFHLTNLLLHSASAALLFLVGRRVFAKVSPAAGNTLLSAAAAVAALGWALHPLRVESVSWITERRDVLSMAFSLAAVLCYIQILDGASNTWRWYAATTACFLLALLSKAVVVTLPLTLLALNVYPWRRISWSDVRTRTAALWRVSAEIAPLLVLSGLWGLLALRALQDLTQMTVGKKLAVAAYGLRFYIERTIAPVGLAPLYEAKPVDPMSAQYLVAYVVVIALVVALLWYRRILPLMTAAFVFLVTTAPLLGAVQNGPQLVADRYTHHATPALFVLAAGALLIGPRIRLAAFGVAGVWLAVLATLTWKQQAVWQTSESVWGRVIEVDPTSGIAHNNLGVVMAAQGKPDQAKWHYQQAIALRANYAEPHNNLGYELAAEAMYEAAISEYRRAIADDSGYADARVNLGNALLEEGKQAEAVQEYLVATRVNPRHAGARLNWGVALALAGDLRGAIAQFDSALVIDPGLTEAIEYRAKARAQLAATPRP